MDISLDLLLKYIQEQTLVLILVLYVLGMILKQLNTVPDKFIPMILVIVGIAFAVWMLGFTVQAVIQGVLVTGVAVLANQIYKQATKDE